MIELWYSIELVNGVCNCNWWNVDWFVVLWNVMNCDEKYGEMWWELKYVVVENGERMTHENVWMCDRESWAGRIATRLCEMARLSRADSLVGGHLIVKWYEKWNEKKCEVESSIPNLMWFDIGWWLEKMIWLRIIDWEFLWLKFAFVELWMC